MIDTEKFQRDGWQKIALFLAGILVSGVAVFFTFAENSATVDDVRSMIEKESPYVTDRELLRQNLQRSTATFEKISAMLQHHDSEISRHDERLRALEKSR